MTNFFFFCISKSYIEETYQVKGKKNSIHDPRCYFHELETEPFSLGIEELPEISKITFNFGYGQSFQNSPGTLIKTKLHNSKLLDKSSGKNFTVKVNHLKLKDN